MTEGKVGIRISLRTVGLLYVWFGFGQTNKIHLRGHQTT